MVFKEEARSQKKKARWLRFSKPAIIKAQQHEAC
jgi:hypothetical protein